jgi:hypothetical protein
VKKQSHGALVRCLLATSSVVGLVVGVQTHASAACYTGPYPFTNAGTLSCVSIASTNFGGVILNTGTIGPGGIAITGSTLSGTIGIPARSSAASRWMERANSPSSAAARSRSSAPRHSPAASAMAER